MTIPLSSVAGLRSPVTGDCGPETGDWRLVSCVWNKRQLPGAHDRRPQLALMHRARARDAARQNLRSLRHERHQQLDVLVVDVVDLIDAELAQLAPAEHRAALLAVLARGIRAALT